MARRHSEGEIGALLREFEGSGLSQGEFAQAVGVSAGTLSRWRRSRAGGAPGFVEVGLAGLGAGRAGGGPYAVEFSGVRVELPAGFDPGSARELLRAAREEVAGC
jgi:hypothetical protein